MQSQLLSFYSRNLQTYAIQVFSKGGYISGVFSFECHFQKINSSIKSKVDESSQLASSICMHIAAMSPMALNENKLDADFINNEKKIIEEQIDKNGKKPEIQEKIIKGKLTKVISENTLMNQKWVIDQELTVNQAISNFNKDKSDNFEVLDFHRLKVGEGIELQKIDFREEVKSLTK